MKETFYFTHDYNARSDQKIKLLLRKHGLLGYGCYWSIIEDLYQNANALRTDYDGIAYDIHCEKNIVESVIKDFDLFQIDGDYFGSLSVERRLNERNEKSSKARKSAITRWEKIKDNANALIIDANALRTEYNRNAIKEKKVKESKIKENKIKENIIITNNIEFREKKFIDDMSVYKDKYNPDVLNSFYRYWSEKTPDGKKMKFELQKTFEISKRLVTWNNNQSKFSNNGTEKPKFTNTANRIDEPAYMQSLARRLHAK